MGLFDKLFHSKEETKKDAILVIHDSIEFILFVLENLGLMNKEQVLVRVRTSEFYDESILDRIDIQAPSNLDYLEKYFGKAKFGYGSLKIQQLRDRLNEIASEQQLAGISVDKIVEGILSLVEPEMVAYAGILIRFNTSLRQAEEESGDSEELATQIEYWKNYYKEHELGYPVPIEKKIEDMVNELSNLPYGGYGEEEIQQFIEAAKKISEEARLHRETPSYTLERITSELFNPMKNSYLSDLEHVKKKIQMIEESSQLSLVEKEQRKQNALKEFSVSKGHKQGLDGFVEQLQQNLTKLDFGGYGEEILNQFVKRAQTMISDGQRIVKPEEEVKKDIQVEYQRLVNHYQEHLQKLREQINNIDQLSYSKPQKDQKKALLLEEFHDEMGHPIDVQERLNALVAALKGLDHGGYGELRMEEFKTNALEKINASTSRGEMRKALKDIREYQEKLISDYQEDLRKLYDTSERIRHDRHMSDEEKQRSIEEIDREFKFKMGYRMNFDKYIENRAEELATLPGGGYGKEAVDEFREIAHSIVTGTADEKDKYDKIRHAFMVYKKQYELHLRTFKEWKRLQLKNISRDQLSTFEKDLNVKIAYMLSLSPSALREYYLEDERKKKEEANKHNYMAAVKYIARKEARNKQDDQIYEMRIKEVEMGQNPYTKKEIEEARLELEVLSVSGDELQEDERIISLTEYVDSTLLRQMMYVEANFMKDTLL